MASPSKLGIIAGTGRLPAQLIDACQHDNRPYFLLAFENADHSELPVSPHNIIRIEAIGQGLEAFRNAGVTELVLAGHVKRPSLFGMQPDKEGKKLLARLGANFFKGDNALLKTIVSFLEDEGFRVVGADEILKSLLTPEGILTQKTPDVAALQDIAIGLRSAKNLGKRDIGQAVIIKDGEIIGEEDKHGTDALIARCTNASGGILVKACKPQQERRADLPAIGTGTIEKIHAIGLAGVAIEAGHSLIIDKDKTITRANELGIFIAGIRHE